jgi:hypothetical protein
MTYIGHIKNGLVILDEPADLPEGATVRVELTEDLSLPAPGEGVMKHAGIVKGLPPDASCDFERDRYGRPGTPQAILEILRQPPHLSKEDVDALEESIQTGKLQRREKRLFEESE